MRPRFKLDLRPINGRHLIPWLHRDPSYHSLGASLRETVFAAPKPLPPWSPRPQSDAGTHWHRLCGGALTSDCRLVETAAKIVRRLHREAGMAHSSSASRWISNWVLPPDIDSLAPLVAWHGMEVWSSVSSLEPRAMQEPRLPALALLYFNKILRPKTATSNLISHPPTSLNSPKYRAAAPFLLRPVYQPPSPPFAFHDGRQHLTSTPPARPHGVVRLPSLERSTLSKDASSHAAAANDQDAESVLPRLYSHRPRLFH